MQPYVTHQAILNPLRPMLWSEAALHPYPRTSATFHRFSSVMSGEGAGGTSTPPHRERHRHGLYRDVAKEWEKCHVIES